jgi:hydroxypyruvate isomerase
MSVTRRSLIKSGLAGVAALNANFSWADETPVPKRKGRVHQSVCRWCYPDISLDKLCEYGAKIGLSGVDLLQPDEYEVPRRYGLVCTMGLIPGVEIPEGYNRLENHARLEDGLRKYLPAAAKAGMKRVITVSGNRKGMDDETGLKNTIIGLNRVKKIGEDNGIIICMELDRKSVV